jgi:hypothetical protein
MSSLAVMFAIMVVEQLNTRGQTKGWFRQLDGGGYNKQLQGCAFLLVFGEVAPVMLL